MKAATLFTVAIVSIWFADALPFPPLPPLQGRGGERGYIQSPGYTPMFPCAFVHFSDLRSICSAYRRAIFYLWTPNATR